MKNEQREQQSVSDEQIAREKATRVWREVMLPNHGDKTEPQIIAIIADIILTRANKARDEQSAPAAELVEAWRDLLPDERPQLGDRFYDPDKRAWHYDELPPDSGKPASWKGWVTNTWQRRASSPSEDTKLIEHANELLVILAQQFNYNAPLPPSPAIQELGLAARELEKTLLDAAMSSPSVTQTETK